MASFRPSHALRVAGAVAEDQIKLGEIRSAHGEGLEHEVLPKALLHRRQVLHCRRADVSAAQFFRQAGAAKLRFVDGAVGKDSCHGRGHALSSAHLNEIVVYQAIFGQ